MRAVRHRQVRARVADDEVHARIGQRSPFCSRNHAEASHHFGEDLHDVDAIRGVRRRASR